MSPERTLILQISVWINHCINKKTGKQSTPDDLKATWSNLSWRHVLSVQQTPRHTACSPWGVKHSTSIQYVIVMDTCGYWKLAAGIPPNLNTWSTDMWAKNSSANLSCKLLQVCMPNSKIYSKTTKVVHTGIRMFHDCLSHFDHNRATHRGDNNVPGSNSCAANWCERSAIDGLLLGY